MVGEAVIVDKIAPVVAVAGDCLETVEGILKRQKLKLLYYLYVEDLFMSTYIAITYHFVTWD